jgi:hypothetical protein
MNPRDFERCLDAQDEIEHNPRAVRVVAALLAFFWIAVGGVVWLVLA